MRLSKPVFWRGRQWAVTRYGLERLDTYAPYRWVTLASNFHPDLLAFEPGSFAYHMAGKRGIDMDDLRTALAVAARVRARVGPVRGMMGLNARQVARVLEAA